VSDSAIVPNEAATRAHVAGTGLCDHYPSVVRFYRDLDAQATLVKTFSTTRPCALSAPDRPPRAVVVTLPMELQSS